MSTISDLAKRWLNTFNGLIWTVCVTHLDAAFTQQSGVYDDDVSAGFADD